MILTETEDQMVKLIVEATQKIPPLQSLGGDGNQGFSICHCHVLWQLCVLC